METRKVENLSSRDGAKGGCDTKDIRGVCVCVSKVSGEDRKR